MVIDNNFEVHSLPQYFRLLQKSLPVTNFRAVLSFYLHSDLALYSIFSHLPSLPRVCEY